MLQGKRNITNSIDLVLEKVLGVKAETWVRFQKNMNGTKKT